ncbi:MAG TPA: methyltransferase domain-containing protein [Acidiferrobacterales bacterium]
MPCPLCHGDDLTPVGEKNSYHIVACRGCGLRHVGDMPTPEALGAYYAAYHGNVKNVRNAARKVARWWRRLLPLRWLARGRTFLDVGCNTGFAVEAARRLGFTASGYDLSDEAIDYARQTYPHCRFEHGTAQTAATEGRTYDAVLCSEMIEHLTELDGFADALAKLVRPGGILYLTTPDAGRFRVPEDLLAWKEVCPPHHLIYFDRTQIRRFLESTGFQVMGFMPVLHKPSIRVFARRV